MADKFWEPRGDWIADIYTIWDDGAGDLRTFEHPRTAGEQRQGLPEMKPYVRGSEAARDAEIAAIVAEARRRAGGTRCSSCGLPAAECEETRCLTVCPEHQAMLVRLSVTGILFCPHRKWRCDYEVAIRAEAQS